MDEFILIRKEKLIEIERKLNEILGIISNKSFRTRQIGDWLPEPEAKLLLNLKTSAMWQLRNNGCLEWSKIGGKVYYSGRSIEELLNKGSSQKI